MLENIAFIASVISAITAVTTALRAVGVSREYSRCERESSIKSSCRAGGLNAAMPPSQRSSLRLHMFVTVIWYVLSIVFSLPLLIGRWRNDSTLLAVTAAFILLAALLVFIWRNVLIQKN